MKKMYVVIAVAVVVATAAWMLPKLRMSNPWLDGKTEPVSRGDLEIPVSASGTIEGEALCEIKPKASGEVTIIRVKEGMMVHAGQELVVLDPVDEIRNLERAQADMARAEAGLRQAEIRRDEAQKNRPLDVDMARARRDQAQAQFDQAALEVEKLGAVTDKTDIETKRAKANRDASKAALDQAIVDFDRTKNTAPIAIGSAEQDVKVANAAYEMAAKSVEESQLRRKETKILSPIDGMVYSIKIAKGNIVQSGKTTLMGGTAVMYLVNVAKMYVTAQVDEADIGAVRKIAPDFAQPGKTREVGDDELFASCPAAGSAPADLAASRKALEAEASLKGRPVRVTVEAYRDETFLGVIERILPEPRLVQNVETFDVRIRLIGKDLEKLLGMQADVQFTSDRVNNVLKVRNEALVSEGKEVFVYVPHRDSDNDLWGEKKVPVRIGMTDGTFTHLRGGDLKEGDKVWIKRPTQTDKEKEKSGKS